MSRTRGTQGVDDLTPSVCACEQVADSAAVALVTPEGASVPATRVLVVANRTAGSAELLNALCEQASARQVAVTLLVPATWDVVDPHGGRETAERNLAAALRRLRAEGLEADGTVGNPDPIVAVRDIWDPARFDEIIVSTLPAPVSKWLKLDLPRRVRRLTGVEVTHIMASAAPAWEVRR